MRDNVKNKSLEIVNLFMGVAMICAIFTFSVSPAAVINAAIVGSIIAMCSLLVLYRYQDWAEWTNLLAGSWAIIAPFVLGFRVFAGADVDACCGRDLRCHDRSDAASSKPQTALVSGAGMLPASVADHGSTSDQAPVGPDLRTAPS